jgi:hypothetical protein
MARPSLAEACGCTGVGPSSAALTAADLVFVGTVTTVEESKPSSPVRAGGSSSGALRAQPVFATFNVAHVFRGSATRQVVVAGDGSDCDEPFQQGEAWLVYAQTRDGRVTTDKCTRTRLRAKASQDLVYLEGVEQRRALAVVYGEVLRRIVGADGRPALQALFESLQVVAIRAGRRFETTTDMWGPYEIVLPPGDFEIWVERAGRPVAPRQTVRVGDGMSRRLLLPGEYPSPRN